MLYIFAGFPQTRLNAGGLQYAIEERMGITVLEHDKGIQYRKEGVFIVTEQGEERLRDVEYWMSDLCLRDGITWDWFPDNWAFGNGVTVHKTLASPEFRTVVHGTDLTLDEYLATFGGIRMADAALVRRFNRTEGWEKYEKRWLPGTCPQENHIVHLTWLVAKHRLPEFAYEAIRQLVEVSSIVNEAEYEPRHFSEVRRWDGKAAIETGAPR